MEKKMKKWFFAVTVVVVSGNAAMAGHWMDWPVANPSASASAGGNAGTAMSGFAFTDSWTATSTGTYTIDNGGFDTNAGYEANAAGATGGSALNFGYGAAWSGISLQASGEADASSNNVSSSVELDAGVSSEGGGDVVLIEQGAMGSVTALGTDAPFYEQGAAASGVGIAGGNVISMSSGTNNAKAWGSISSSVSVKTDVVNTDVDD